MDQGGKRINTIGGLPETTRIQVSLYGTLQKCNHLLRHKMQSNSSRRRLTCDTVALFRLGLMQAIPRPICTLGAWISFMQYHAQPACRHPCMLSRHSSLAICNWIRAHFLGLLYISAYLAQPMTCKSCSVAHPSRPNKSGEEMRFAPTFCVEC